MTKITRITLVSEQLENGSKGPVIQEIEYVVISVYGKCISHYHVQKISSPHFSMLELENLAIQDKAIFDREVIFDDEC
jgi:hypothetical protein